MSDAIVDVVSILRLYPGVPFRLVRADGTLGPLQGGESDELAIADRAERLYPAARASDDSVHDAIYSGFFDIPNARLADLFRAGDQAELGRLIFEAADKVLRENAKDRARDDYMDAHE